jgi:hypothetical protein
LGYVAARVCKMASGRAKELWHSCTVLSPARASKSEATCETERRIKSNTSNHPPPQSRQSILNSWPRACGRVADAAERCKRTAASVTFQRAAARPQRSPRTPATVPGHQRPPVESLNSGSPEVLTFGLDPEFHFGSLPPSKCLLDSEYSLKRRNRTFWLWVQPDGRRQSVGRIVVGALFPQKNCVKFAVV